jgi:hypothetical protein
MHGHSENPNLCHFSSCERSIPGNGFPRRWNLRDHMKRVHDYTLPEGVSSPEESPVTGRPAERKDKPARKRKGTCPAGTKTTKRSRGGGSKMRRPHAHHSQLQLLEQKYYSCKSRLQDAINNLQLQDPTSHEIAIAALQELITLGLNYRCIRAEELFASPILAKCEPPTRDVQQHRVTREGRRV